MCHHSKHLTGFFEFLNGSRKIFLPFNILEKNYIDNIWITLILIAFIFVNMIQHPRTLNNNIYHSNKREPPPFFHSDTNTWPYVLVHSVEKTHVLVLTVELIWMLFLNILLFQFCAIDIVFQFCSNTKQIC